MSNLLSREGESLRSYKLTRSKVEDDGVTYEVKDSSKHIGYIRISTFRKGTSKIIQKRYRDAKNRGLQ